MGKKYMVEKVVDTKACVDEFEKKDENGYQIYSRIYIKNYMPLPDYIPNADRYAIALVIRRGTPLRNKETFESVMSESDDNPLKKYLDNFLTKEDMLTLRKEKAVDFDYVDWFKFNGQCSSDRDDEYSYGYRVIGVRLYVRK